MGDKPWKVHERVVARYFGVERQKRGNDFGVSDCDVLASAAEYEKSRGQTIPYSRMPVTHIIVECKRHKNLGLHQWMKEFSQGCTRIPILTWGAFRCSWMEYKKRRVFDQVFDELIPNESMTFEYLAGTYSIGHINRPVPKYLKEWYEQALEYGRAFSLQYVEKNPEVDYVQPLPLIAVGQKGMHGRVIAWKNWNEV